MVLYNLHGMLDLCKYQQIGQISFKQTSLFSGEWLLLDITVKRNEVRYACCIEPYPDVTFTIIMRRRTLYYLFNVVFPCLWLSVLSLLGFWLPADSGEKVTLGITVLLAFSVFMLLIAESMPATSEFVPLIGTVTSRKEHAKHVLILLHGVDNTN